MCYNLYIYICSICYDIFYCYILLHVVTTPPHPYAFISPYPIPPTLCVFVCFYICYLYIYTVIHYSISHCLVCDLVKQNCACLFLLPLEFWGVDMPLQFCSCFFPPFIYLIYVCTICCICFINERMYLLALLLSPCSEVTQCG